MINEVIVSGYLSKFYKVFYTKSGKKMATFSLYQKRKDNVQYIPVIAFDRTAEFFEKYVKDGMYLECLGYLSVSTDTVDASSGKKVTKLSFIASSINTVGAAGEARKPEQKQVQSYEKKKPAPPEERFSDDIFRRAEDGIADFTGGMNINPDDLPF